MHIWPEGHGAPPQSVESPHRPHVLAQWRRTSPSWLSEYPLEDDLVHWKPSHPTQWYPFASRKAPSSWHVVGATVGAGVAAVGPGVHRPQVAGQACWIFSPWYGCKQYWRSCEQET